MVGNHGGRGSDGRLPGAVGPFRRDQGALGTARGWGGRGVWARRDGAQHDRFRGARAGTHFGRGHGDQCARSGRVGRGGPPNSAQGRWVWQEERRGAASQEKGNGEDKIGDFSAAQQPSDSGAGVVQGPGLGSELGIAEELVGGQEGGEASRLGGRCSRCSKKGHHAVSCKAEVLCVICSSQDHMNHKYQLVKAPRPVAQAVGYAVMGLGFYHIPHPPLPKLKKDSKKAMVSVVGGILSGEQLITQLKRVVPVNWNWELKDLGEGRFLTKFPSKTELLRSIAYGGADAKGEGTPHGIRLKFEEWHDKDKGILLPKVWMRVTCIDESLREFLILWVVGSRLGAM